MWLYSGSSRAEAGVLNRVHRRESVGTDGQLLSFICTSPASSGRLVIPPSPPKSRLFRLMTSLLTSASKNMSSRSSRFLKTKQKKNHTHVCTLAVVQTGMHPRMHVLSTSSHLILCTRTHAGTRALAGRLTVAAVPELSVLRDLQFGGVGG